MKNILDFVSDIFYMASDIYDIPRLEPVMPFREKSAWISLVVTLLVWGGYYFHVYIWPGDMHGLLAMQLFFAAIVITVIVQVLLHLLIAARAPADARSPADERDQLIGLTATRWGFYALATGALLAVLTMHLGASKIDMAYGVLAALAFAEIARCAGVIVAYRRGV